MAIVLEDKNKWIINRLAEILVLVEIKLISRDLGRFIVITLLIDKLHCRPDAESMTPTVLFLSGCYHVVIDVVIDLAMTLCVWS